MARRILDILKRHVALNQCVALDAGGGTGSFAEKLLDSGVGKVYLFDRSQEMLSIAETRLARFGDRAIAWQASIEDTIRLDDQSVSLILCVQVLHYIDNWNPISAEFSRVLKEDGYVLIVTAHPVVDIVLRGSGRYFECEQRKGFLTSGGKLWPLTYWRRPLEAMLAPFLSSGFVLVDFAEPYLHTPKRRAWWDIAESLFQYFPPYVILVFRKLS
jgi:SAM-dependent methyltransferase